MKTLKTAVQNKGIIKDFAALHTFRTVFIIVLVLGTIKIVKIFDIPNADQSKSGISISESIHQSINNKSPE
jgi:hypothetical protein